MTFSLASAGFANGQPIPKIHAQAGTNETPPLQWQGVPEGTESLVLVVENHDAPVGTVTHWVVYDIPAVSHGLLEGLDSNQASQTVNDMGHAHYDGPKSPKGHGAHRYHFRLAALDTASLNLSDQPSVNDIKKAARSHVIVRLPSSSAAPLLADQSGAYRSFSTSSPDKLPFPINGVRYGS